MLHSKPFLSYSHCTVGIADASSLSSVVPPRPQATASVRAFFFVEMAVVLPAMFVGHRQHYAKAVDFQFSGFLSIYLGAQPNLWSPKVMYSGEIFCAAPIILCRMQIHAINLSAQFLTDSSVTQKSLSS